MMYGSGKSDRRMVPTKPPNKRKPPSRDFIKVIPTAGTKVETPETDKGGPKVRSCRSGRTAEEVEGRRLAKRNLRQQNMLRTQGRASMHNALGRVRQAARPNFRFDVRYSRQEPSALAALAGICAGGPG